MPDLRIGVGRVFTTQPSGTLPVESLSTCVAGFTGGCTYMYLQSVAVVPTYLRIYARKTPNMKISGALHSPDADSVWSIQKPVNVRVHDVMVTRAL